MGTEEVKSLIQISVQINPLNKSGPDREAVMHIIIFSSSSSFTVQLHLLFADWKMQKRTNKNSDKLNRQGGKKHFLKSVHRYQPSYSDTPPSSSSSSSDLITLQMNNVWCFIVYGV